MEKKNGAIYISPMVCDATDEIPEWILLQLWYQKWPDDKSSIDDWSQVAERKENPQLPSSSERITLLVDDTGSKCTSKPTTLYYYGWNYHGVSLMLINLLLKVFLVHLNLHNKHAMISFESVCVFFCSLFVFIQRFHNVATLHQSCTKVRAGADGEGEWGGADEKSLVHPGAHCPCVSTGEKAFLTRPHQKKEERKKQTQNPSN